MTTPATIPSPADMPRAGLSRIELLRRQEAAQDAAAALLAGGPIVPPELLAPPGDLERLADDDPEPVPAQPPVGLNRYQEIRDRALSHALRRYELDDQAAMDDEKVIATADRFADWIRRGYHL